MPGGTPRQLCRYGPVWNATLWSARLEQEQTIAFDLVRMFLGDDPPLFYLEIVVRTLIIYLYSLLMLRWIGSRTIAQLSTVEFLLVIALGSAVGDATFYPDVPLFHALLVITAVVLLDKGIDRLINRYRFFKVAIDGEPIEVVRGGVIDLANLARRDLSVEELHEMLRLAGIANLGEIDFAYVEASGQPSIFKASEPRKGLAIMPVLDHPERLGVDQLSKLPGGAVSACTRCGTTGAPPPLDAKGNCKTCGASSWTEAQASPLGGGAASARRKAGSRATSAKRPRTT